MTILKIVEMQLESDNKYHKRQPFQLQSLNFIWKQNSILLLLLRHLHSNKGCLQWVNSKICHGWWNDIMKGPSPRHL